MKLSVIVPTLNESAYIGSCLETVRQSFSGEIIVADGGSEDGTPDKAAVFEARVLKTSPGLAKQCNEAVKKAKGEVLFFLSADSRVPSRWHHSIQKALENESVVGGGFRLRLEGPFIPYFWIALGGNYRSRSANIALGDQGVFVRRSAFEAVGGFSESSLIPYALLCFQLHQRGKFVLLKDRMLSSVRKWRKKGVWATAWEHYWTYRKFRQDELPLTKKV